MKQTLSSFFGIFFATMVLYPTVSSAVSCISYTESASAFFGYHLPNKITKDGRTAAKIKGGDEVFYCGHDDEKGCEKGQILRLDNGELQRCNVEGVNDWRMVDPAECPSVDVANTKYANRGKYTTRDNKSYIYFYTAEDDNGDGKYKLKKNVEPCKLLEQNVASACEKSGGKYNSSSLSCDVVKVETEPEKSAEQVACENTKGTWASDTCSCSGNYYTNDNKTCIEKKSGEPCSASDLAKITGAASGTYNSNLKCVLGSCKNGLEEVVKNGVRQGWCNKPQSQNDGETQGGGNWWTLLVGSIK